MKSTSHEYSATVILLGILVVIMLIFGLFSGSAALVAIAFGYWIATKNPWRYRVVINIGLVLHCLQFVQAIYHLVCGGVPLSYTGLILALPAIFRKSWGGGNLEDAEAMIEEAIAREPNFAFSYRILADVYLAMGKKELAREQLEKAMSIREVDLPEYAAENRFDRKRAQEKMREIFPKMMPAPGHHDGPTSDDDAVK